MVYDIRQGRPEMLSAVEVPIRRHRKAALPFTPLGPDGPFAGLYSLTREIGAST